MPFYYKSGLHKWCSGKEPIARDVRDAGSIPGSGRFPGGGNGKPLQYSCLENSMDRSAWQNTVHGVTEFDMTEQLSTQTLVQVRKNSFFVVCLFRNKFQGYAVSTCYDQLSATHE